MDKSLIIGENCLKSFLENNNNCCPIQSHDNCQYSRNDVIQKCVDNLTVICIRQFEQDLKISQEIEGERKISEIIKCNFGKVKDLTEHLNNECPLNSINCWFKPFGCNHIYHLITDMKLHFDLVSELFECMKKEIELKDKQIIEKNNQIKQMERELLKNRADIEIAKKDFNDKEKKMVYDHEKIIKLLEEKNMKITQNYEQLNKKLNDPYKEKEEYKYSTLSPSSTSNYSKHLLDIRNVIWSIDYSIFDDCELICSGSNDQKICVWDINNNKQIQSYNACSNVQYCVKFSSYYYNNYNRYVICSALHNTTIRFWDFKKNQQFQILNGHNDAVYGIEFSKFNGGKYLCSGSVDKTIRLWDIETSKLLHTFNGHERDVRCIDISPLQNNNNYNDNNKIDNSIGIIGGNGYTICSGSFDNTIRVWDIETTKQLNLFKGHKNQYNIIWIRR
ncbi:serine/threonine protein kinase [Reticulomyxa filosa]|uniref:Serine/threonine protein kinase n=1 Tax=Reticulomyxa filosa TaxID=46433 RepID=X6M0K6_RETFI|nr:serine/threonine protein kinase [Reticulomyxa filosa]|eukprot:ETO07713.1 serine/threonine protein kinase [Reticulomyxa filosa]